MRKVAVSARVTVQYLWSYLHTVSISNIHVESGEVIHTDCVVNPEKYDRHGSAQGTGCEYGRSKLQTAHDKRDKNIQEATSTRN